MAVALVNVTAFALALLMPVVGMRLRKTALVWLLGLSVAGLFAALWVHLPLVQQHHS
jgi:hypothetical protein